MRTSGEQHQHGSAITGRQQYRPSPLVDRQQHHRSPLVDRGRQPDLYLEDDTGKNYVSWGVDGTVSFVDQSSASTTTIFAVSCRGLLTIRKGGASHTWRVDDTGFTTVTPGEAEDGIAVLRPDLSKQLDAAGSSEPEVARVRRLIRHENGYMPRCPVRDLNIFAIPRPGRRSENPNGCGSNNGMGSSVPDFHWGHCCNDHDNCYDDCGKSFQGCNNGFLGCMYSQCSADVKWWNFWVSGAPLFLGPVFPQLTSAMPQLYPGCIATANFYWVFVSSPLGTDAFYTANDERCTCPCPNPALQEVCLRSDNQLECRVVKGNDNNNCGGCGWSCGYRQHCSSGGCACDDQRCGNTCVNMSNNPHNCGTCGNVCASGFCYQGRCYDPPEEPDVCIPGEGFRNGRFLNGNSTGWTVDPTVPTRFTQFDVHLAIPDPKHKAPDGYITLLFPVLGAPSLYNVDLISEVRLCPGVAYDLSVMLDIEGSTNVYTTVEAVVNGRHVVCTVELATPPPTACPRRRYPTPWDLSGRSRSATRGRIR